MTKADLILINVYYSESGYGDKLYSPPLGIGYISEYLEQKGIDHHIIDMGLGYSNNDIFEKINELKPFWVGISLNSLQIDRTKQLINGIKSNNSNVKIVIGGPHVTTEGANSLLDFDGADYAIAGEGEKSFYDLVTDVDKGRISGLIYKDSDENIISNPRVIVENIDVLPFPKFNRFELDSYLKKTIPIITSRGCPYKCIFCQQSSLLSKNWRGVSANYFINLIKYWNDRGYKEIEILDDNFIFDIHRLEKMVDLYEKEKINDLKLNLVGGVRISSSKREILMLLKRLGVEYISFGIESFSDNVLSFIKKGTNTKQIEKVVSTAADIGFKVRLFFIIGFPYQTKESLRETYKFVLKYPIYQVRFFNLIPYQNTLIFDWLSNHGQLIFPPSVYMNDFKKYQDIPVFEAENTLSIEERLQELKIAREFESLINERAKFLFGEL